MYIMYIISSQGGEDKEHGLTFRLLMKAGLMVIAFTVVRNMEKDQDFREGNELCFQNIECEIYL